MAFSISTTLGRGISSLGAATLGHSLCCLAPKIAFGWLGAGAMGGSAIVSTLAQPTAGLAVTGLVAGLAGLLPKPSFKRAALSMGVGLAAWGGMTATDFNRQTTRITQDTRTQQFLVTQSEQILWGAVDIQSKHLVSHPDRKTPQGWPLADIPENVADSLEQTGHFTPLPEARLERGIFGFRPVQLVNIP